jgi:DNA primase
MIRIPREEVEQLKHETDLAALVRASGVELATHGAGGDLIGRCPFHDDRTPSLVVSPAKGAGQPALWHCLGACGVGGSVIDWIMKMRRVGFRHAIEVLREMKSGAGVVGGTAPAPSLLRKRLPPLAGLDAGDRQLMTQVVDYYHQRLKQSPDALAYLQKRGIGSAEAIEQFKIGYADRTLGMRLPQKVTQAGAQIRGRLEKLGLYRQTGREHFNGCVVFPVIDPTTGEVTEVYGRKTIARLRPDLPRHLYLPGGHKGIWNEKALAACEEMILCESIIDALTFWCAGFRNVTCSYGTNGFTSDHLAAFKRYGTKRILIAYDRDDAGEEGAAKLWPDLAAAGIECYRVQFPKWMDANEYALKLTPASKSLDLVLRKAVWLGKGEAPPRAMPALMTVEITEPAPPLGKPAAKEQSNTLASFTGVLSSASNAAPLSGDPSTSAPPASSLNATNNTTEEETTWMKRGRS